jgi:hypothetical protein
MVVEAMAVVVVAIVGPSGNVLVQKRITNASSIMRRLHGIKQRDDGLKTIHLPVLVD